MDNRHRAAQALIEKAVLEGPGHTPAALRQAVATRAGVPPELAALVEKIHLHAYKVSDEEVEVLKERYSEDQLFEIFIAAALGAATRRCEAALAALEQV